MSNITHGINVHVIYDALYNFASITQKGELQLTMCEVSATLEDH